MSIFLRSARVAIRHGALVPMQGRGVNPAAAASNPEIPDGGPICAGLERKTAIADRQGQGRRPMNRVSKIAFGVAVSLLASRPVLAEPAADVQTRCFRFAGQPAKLMQLRLVGTDDGNESAFVRDAGSHAWLPLVLSRSKSTPMADSGREQLDEEWLEVVRDQVGGRYLLSMMGAEVLSFDYVDRKTGAKTEFTLAPAPRGVDPCESKSR